jgi:hypothetical protein
MNKRYASALGKKLASLGTIYGVDPGGNTGFVKVCGGLIEEHMTYPLGDVYSLCASWNEKCLFVMEDFLLYPWVASKLSFDTLPAPRAIGAFYVAAHRTGSTVVMQTASAAKEAVENDLIHAVFPYIPQGTTKHEMDALRHVVLYTSLQLTRLDTRRRHGV